MYRWGYRGNHSYVLGAYSTDDLAVAAAEQEAADRSGKYEYEIAEAIVDGKLVYPFRVELDKDLQIETMTHRLERLKRDRKVTETMRKVVDMLQLGNKARKLLEECFEKD